LSAGSNSIKGKSLAMSVDYQGLPFPGHYERPS
jgi:hypothetical protein